MITANEDEQLEDELIVNLDVVNGVSVVTIVVVKN